MLLNRDRFLALGGILVLFLLIVVGYTWWRVTFERNHFQAGRIPQEIINQLLPKEVPLESMHPPAIRVSDPLRYGGATSVVSVIEYGDFECPYCKLLAAEIKTALEPYGGQVRFVWRDFPITQLHSQAMPAAVFARCAAAQGRFWEAYDALMATQSLNESTYQNIATRIGLDGPTLRSCRSNPAIEAAIKQDVQESSADGIHSAPFLFIGTKAIEGYIDAKTITDTLSASKVGL